MAEKSKPNETLFSHLCGFWICGLINNFGYVVMLSAAEDIVHGNAGAVLAADIMPTLIVKATAPFWTHKIPYPVRITLCGVFSILSFLIVSLTNTIGLKLFGVVFASISSGWGEATFLALSSFYEQSTITAWSSGTGFAGIAGFGAYAFLRKIIGLSARNSLLAVSPLPIMYILSYFFLLTKKTPSSSCMREFSSETSDLENEELLVKDRKISNAAIMTSSEKLSMILRLKKFMIPLAIVYYAEYVINSGVNGTVGFEDMQPHDFYVLAGLVYQIGVFLSRSSGSIFPISVLWPLPVFQMLNLVYFVLQSMTGLIPLKQIVFLIVFWEGLLGGATYVNAFALINKEVEPQHREWSLGVASVADSIGIVLASITSLFLECALNRYNGRPAHNCLH